MYQAERVSCKICATQRLSVFSGLGIDDSFDIPQECRVYRRREVLFTEGTYPKGLFCVKSGKIKLSQLGADGREQIVHLIHNGDVMGYRAILGEDVYSCTATAMEESIVCFIPISDFLSLLEVRPTLLMRITRILAEKLKEAEYNITRMAHQPVKDRLIYVLFTLIESYGFKEDKTTINLNIKREDLANFAGTTRETATRVLYELRGQGILSLHGKYIKVIDIKKLRSSYQPII